MTGWRPIETPCVKICQIEPQTGLCYGCGRSLREIGGWSGLSDAERAHLMQNVLPGRMAAMPAMPGARPGR